MSKPTPGNILKVLLQEIKLQNDGATTEAEFCVEVMKLWKIASDALEEGKPLPEWWHTESQAPALELTPKEAFLLAETFWQLGGNVQLITAFVSQLPVEAGHDVRVRLNDLWHKLEAFFTGETGAIAIVNEE